MSDQPSVAALVDGAVERFGRLDIMVAHAGITDFRPIATNDYAVWSRILRVNLDGVLHCILEAARAMPDGGAIVATGSTNAFWVEGGAAAYNASKGGVVALVKTAALELGPRGIRVNVIHPASSTRASRSSSSTTRSTPRRSWPGSRWVASPSPRTSRT